MLLVGKGWDSHYPFFVPLGAKCTSFSLSSSSLVRAALCEQVLTTRLFNVVIWWLELHLGYWSMRVGFMHTVNFILLSSFRILPFSLILFTCEVDMRIDDVVW